MTQTHLFCQQVSAAMNMLQVYLVPNSGQW